MKIGTQIFNKPGIFPSPVIILVTFGFSVFTYGLADPVILYDNFNYQERE